MLAAADGLAGLRAQRLQVGGEHPVGAEHRLHAHRRGEVGGAQQQVEVGAGQHQLAEHAVGAVDQRQPLLLGQHDRRRCRLRRSASAARRSRARRGRAPSPSPISASATCASGARSPEQPSEPYSGTTGRDAGVEQRRPARARSPAGRRSGRWPASTAAAASAPAPPRARPRRRTPAACERISERCSGARRCGRDVLGRQRTEAGRDAVVRLGVVGQRLHDLPRRGDGRERLGRSAPPRRRRGRPPRPRPR